MFLPWDQHMLPVYERLLKDSIWFVINNLILIKFNLKVNLYDLQAFYCHSWEIGGSLLAGLQKFGVVTAISGECEYGKTKVLNVKNKGEDNSWNW